MDELIDEYQTWQIENGFIGAKPGADLDANELLLVDAVVHSANLLTPEQRTWLHDFMTRWDRQQGLVDRLANLIDRLAA